MGFYNDIQRKKNGQNGRNPAADAARLKAAAQNVASEIGPVKPTGDGRTWFQAGEFEDGYQAFDVLKTIRNSSADLLQNATAGILGIGEGVLDAVATLEGGVAGLFGADEFAEDAKEFVKKDIIDEKAIAKTILTLSNPLAMVGTDTENGSIFGEKSKALAQSAGQLVGTMGLQAVGVPWFLTTGLTSFGGEAENAFNQGASYGEAIGSAAISTGAEILTEKLFGGIKFGGKTLDDALLQPFINKISNKVVRTLVNLGVDMTGEGAEEVVSQIFGNLGSALYKEESLDKLLLSEEATDGYIESFIGGMALGGGAGSVQAVKGVRAGRDYKTGLTENEQKVVDAEVQSRIDEAQKDGKTLTKKEKAAIEEQVKNDLQKGYISTDTIESVLGGQTYEEYQNAVAKEKAAAEQETKLKEEISKLIKTPETQFTIEQRERLTELREQLKNIDKTSNKGEVAAKLSKEVQSLLTREKKLGNKSITQKDNYLLESYNERARRTQVFDADLSKYKGKAQETIKKAVESGILNNTNRTHEFVDMVAKISADKGVPFDFVNNAKLKETGFAIADKTVNGYMTSDGVTVNIDSAKSLNSVVGHELMHVLEGTELYDALQNTVFEYAKTKGEYDTRYAAIEKLYANIEGADVNAELAADLVGDYLFTDADFVNNLSVQHRNVFQKIYDEIKYLYKVAMAGSREARELEKAKKIFEKAYRAGGDVQKNTVAEDGVRYSISRDIDGNVFVDVTEDIFDKNSGESVARTIQRVIHERFNNLIDVHGQKIQINKTTNDEFRYSDSAKTLLKYTPQIYNDKLKTIANADEILSAAKNWIGEENKHTRADDIVEFARGNVSYRVGGNGYVADVIVGIRKNGAAVLYDLVNICNKKITEAPHTMVSDEHSQRRSGASANINISQTAQNVKRKNSLSAEGDHIDKYTEKQYNDFGWARDAEAISKKELDDMYSKIHEKGSLKKFPQTSMGEAIIEVNNKPHTTLDTDNVFVFVTGTKNQPKIERILKVNAFDEETLEYFRKDIYVQSRTGYRTLEAYARRIGEEFLRYYDRSHNANYREYTNKTRAHGSGSKGENDTRAYRNGNWRSGAFEQAQANEITPVKASSKDGAFFDASKTKTSLSENAQTQKRYGDYNVSGEDIKLDGTAPTQDIVPKNTVDNTVAEEAPEVATESATPTADIAPSEPSMKRAEPRMKRADSKNKAPHGKEERSFIETATGSEAVDGVITPDDVPDALRYYEVKSNKKSLEAANRIIEKSGFSEARKYFDNRMESEKITAEDMALGQRLIQEAAKAGDTKACLELLIDTSIIGTEYGQVIQAMSMIRRLSPEGQFRALTRTVERGKARGDKAFDGVEKKDLDEMGEIILKTYNKDGTFDQEKLNAAVEEAKQKIADKMKVTKLEKANAWRYLSMLGNPKTHARNVISNAANFIARIEKNAIARTVEDIAPVVAPKWSEKHLTRAKTWMGATDDVKAFAKQTTEEMSDAIKGDNKYSEGASIKEKRRIFKTKAINWAANFNTKALEWEDTLFSKYAFKQALQEYLTANGIDTKDAIMFNPEIVEKAKDYALEEARRATFRQDSYIAKKIGEIERKNPIYGVIIGSTMPFKKTPINVAKTGLAYSPLGIARNIYDAVKVHKGEMDASEAIDHIAQTLTGTSLTLAGVFLASLGVLNGAGNDDKEGKYDYQLGKQTYSFNFGGNTYSLSWLSPAAMPLFVGVNAYEQLVEGKEWDVNMVIDALGQTLDPLSEMSFVSGLNDVLSSYDDGIGKIWGAGESMLQNYATQFVPTLSSQIASIADTNKRSTQASRDSGFSFGEETLRKMAYKIPGLRSTLEPTTDIWGEEVEQGNFIERVWNSLLNPANKREGIETAVDTELKDLYRQTGDAGLIPSIPYSYFNYDGEKYEMSADEYTEFKQEYGQTAYSLLETLFDTDTYRAATSEERAEMVNKIYDYARDETRKSYLAGLGVDFTNATEDGEEYYKENPIVGALEADLPVDEYTFSVEYPEKYEFFKKNGISYETYSNADEDGKRAYSWAYENPGKYELSKAITDDFMEYYSYKSEMNCFDAKDENGETVSGLKKERVRAYINGLDLDYGQKMILYRSMYDSKEDQKTYNKAIVEYLNGREDISYEQGIAILKELGMTVRSDGTVTW